MGLYIAVPVDWSIVVCPSSLRPLIIAHIGSNMRSNVTPPDNSSAHLTDPTDVAGGFNVQKCQLAEAEQHTGGPFAVLADRTDNADRLFRVYSDHRLFLANTLYGDKATLAYRPSSLYNKVEHRLTTFPLVNTGTDRSRIVGHSDPQLWIQIVLWSVLVFVYS